MVRHGGGIMGLTRRREAVGGEPQVYRIRLIRRWTRFCSFFRLSAQADAICDRLLHNAHRIELKGHTKRYTNTPPKALGKDKP